MTYVAPRLSSLGLKLIEIGHEARGRYFWHNTDDIYVIFLAEFFLRRSNRTTVARFLPGFLTEFPDFSRLAQADREAVVVSARWAGLSSRLKHLPDLARKISSEPCWTAGHLVELPYIGKYAAEGIALYAYDEPHFPIDNNVRRIVGRYFSLRDDVQIVDEVERLKVYLMGYGGIDQLKAAHRGALALGWDACRSQPACARCPLESSCRLVRETNRLIPTPDSSCPDTSCRR